MDTSKLLHLYLENATKLNPDREAVIVPGEGSLLYRELEALSNRLRDRLRAMGVGRGDRVAIYVRKSADAVASMYGIMKTGAAYVPLDPGAPVSRNAYIMNNCSVSAAIIERRCIDKLRTEYAVLGKLPPMLLLDSSGTGDGLRSALEREDQIERAPQANTAMIRPSELAYILYTSGSTGKPKGVMISHESAIEFVDWCSEIFEPRSADRFSSHAPFHFDLSILDLHVSLKHGAAVVLISEDTGKDPSRLASLIADQRITVWYSAPSILSLLAQFGNLDLYDYTPLRLLLFAGEVFPIRYLKLLNSLLPTPRYFNLYGPTETNVCTYFEVQTPIPDSRDTPVPIGKVCSHYRGIVVDGEGKKVLKGMEGELCISGLGVMQGYWALPEQNERAFLDRSDGLRWYQTGDIVLESDDGNYTYLGRRDRMVKRRGYRVELGEIESGLYRHPIIKEAAIVSIQDGEFGLKIAAHLSCREDTHPSLIEMKRFCAENLPLYMVPDTFVWHDALPKTSTDKIDYQQLKEQS